MKTWIVAGWLALASIPATAAPVADWPWVPQKIDGLWTPGNPQMQIVLTARHRENGQFRRFHYLINWHQPMITEEGRDGTERVDVHSRGN